VSWFTTTTPSPAPVSPAPRVAKSPKISQEAKPKPPRPVISEPDVKAPEAPKFKKGIGAPTPGSSVKTGALCGDLTWIGNAEGDKRNAVFTGRNLNMRKEVISDFWMKPQALPSLPSLNGGWYAREDDEDGEQYDGEQPMHGDTASTSDSKANSSAASTGDVYDRGPPPTVKLTKQNFAVKDADDKEVQPEFTLAAGDLNLAALRPPTPLRKNKPLPVPIKASGEVPDSSFHQRSNAKPIERRPTPFRRPSPRKARLAAAREGARASDELVSRIGLLGRPSPVRQRPVLQNVGLPPTLPPATLANGLSLASIQEKPAPDSAGEIGEPTVEIVSAQAAPTAPVKVQPELDESLDGLHLNGKD